MKLFLLILSLFLADFGISATPIPVCFEIIWQANHGPGPSAVQLEGSQKFITINGRTPVFFLQDNSRRPSFDSQGKYTDSLSRGCVKPGDFFLGNNQIEFSFSRLSGESINEGYLSIYVNIRLPNGTNRSIATAIYYPDPKVRQWSLTRKFETDLNSLAPDLANQAELKRRELAELSSAALESEQSFENNDRDYEAVLNSVRGKDFFELSLDELVRYQQAAERYRFHRQGLEAKKSEIARKTEELKLATQSAKAQIHAAIIAQGFDLNSDTLLGLDLAVVPLEPFASPLGSEQPAVYPYKEWAEQALAAMKADLEFGARGQFLLKAYQWQDRIEKLIAVIQSRADVSREELNAFDTSVLIVNQYLFGASDQNSPGILSRDLWFNDLKLDPTVKSAIDGELSTYRPELAKRLKAAINELSNVENFVMQLRAVALIAQMYKAAENEAEQAFLDKMITSAVAVIEAAPSIGACIAKNAGAGPYGDFYELYYGLDFCTGKPNDEVDKYLAAGSLMIEAGSFLLAGPMGPMVTEKFELAARFLKRIVSTAHSAMSTPTVVKLEEIRVLATTALTHKLLTNADDLRALAKGAPEIDSEMTEKILRGAPKPRKKMEIIGVHSPSVINDAAFKVEIVSKNSDNTLYSIVQKDLGNGILSNPKESVLFPISWSDEKILNACRIVAGSSAIAKRSHNGIETTLHRLIIDGVEVIALRDGNRITSVFPTGRVGALLGGFDLI